MEGIDEDEQVSEILSRGAPTLQTSWQEEATLCMASVSPFTSKGSVQRLADYPGWGYSQRESGSGSKFVP